MNLSYSLKKKKKQGSEQQETGIGEKPESVVEEKGKVT